MKRGNVSSGVDGLAHLQFDLCVKFEKCQVVVILRMFVVWVEFRIYNAIVLGRSTIVGVCIIVLTETDNIGHAVIVVGFRLGIKHDYYPSLM